jgi:transcriptional regulator with XRE-family HTH domain
MSYPEELVTTLKKAREKVGLSQRALAEKVGIPQSHVSKIESGKISPTISNLIEIARVLGFELMAVPKKYVSVVEGLSRDTTNSLESQKPAYTLDPIYEDVFVGNKKLHLDNEE